MAALVRAGVKKLVSCDDQISRQILVACENACVAVLTTHDTTPTRQHSCVLAFGSFADL
jgi:hypothetical protein